MAQAELARLGGLQQVAPVAPAMTRDWQLLLAVVVVSDTERGGKERQASQTSSEKVELTMGIGASGVVGVLIDVRENSWILSALPPRT